MQSVSKYLQLLLATLVSQVAAQNYSTIGAAQGICGDDYVCQDYYYGYFYCCDPWYTTGWAIAVWVILGICVLACLVVACVCCCKAHKEDKEAAERAKKSIYAAPAVELAPQPVTTTTTIYTQQPQSSAPVAPAQSAVTGTAVSAAPVQQGVPVSDAPVQGAPVDSV